jgi:hypothetical protein
MWPFTKSKARQIRELTAEVRSLRTGLEELIGANHSRYIRHPGDWCWYVARPLENVDSILKTIASLKDDHAEIKKELRETQAAVGLTRTYAPAKFELRKVPKK